MSVCRILCTARCKHNDGTGYYNICDHERLKNMPSYVGIDRRYVEGCTLKEDPNDKESK